MRADSNRADDEVGHEADAQQHCHEMHGRGVSVGFRNAMSNLVFTNVVDDAGPAIPAADQAVSTRP